MDVPLRAHGGERKDKKEMARHTQTHSTPKSQQPVTAAAAAMHTHSVPRWSIGHCRRCRRCPQSVEAPASVSQAGPALGKALLLPHWREHFSALHHDAPPRYDRSVRGHHARHSLAGPSLGQPQRAPQPAKPDRGRLLRPFRLSSGST